MTTDDILRMAREADLTLQDDDGGEVSRWREDKDLTPYLERFAALVAAAEQERWVKAINDEPELPGDMPDAMWACIANDRDACTEALRIAVRQTKDAIRARGKT